ncbi:MAG: hypothetical protein CMO80_00905 [Verrucomicrobiales bacterium]|nr:hypothetical protein [Verrucomicrobiales bacterium]
MFPDRISGIHELLIKHIECELEGYSFKLCDIHHLAAIEDVANRTDVIRHKERKFGRGCVGAWRENQAGIRCGFVAALNRFRGTLTANEFLFGGDPAYADFALAGVLENYLYPEANDLDDQPWLLDWLKRWDGITFK